MTKEELLKKIQECRELNEKFEALYNFGLKPNTTLADWTDEVREDIANNVIQEKIIDIIGQNLGDLNLYGLSLIHYNWSIPEDVKRYENDRLNVINKCKNAHQT